MLSIIIVSYNTCDLLDQCLESIDKHCPGSEVIIVDNGSRDDSVQMVQTKYPHVKMFDTGKNLGFAGANNLGLEASTGEFVILLNSDTVLEDDGLLRCVEYMEQNPAIGAVSPSLIGMDDKPQRAYHAFPSVGKRLKQAFTRNREIKLADPGETGWLAGTALMIRRQALEDIGGGLDGDYWMYWEDADTSAHLLRKGWKVEEFTGARIRHIGGASGGGPDAARRSDLYAHYAWGEHRWFSKNRPWWEFFTVLALDFVDVFRRTARGLLRKNRRSELVHARVMAKVLGCTLIGRRPSVPS